MINALKYVSLSQSFGLSMDPLSDVLSLLKPRSQFHVGFDAAGDWSFEFPALDGIKFAAVVRGTCWAATSDMAEPLRFGPGDCYLLNHRQRLRLASAPGLPAQDFSNVMEAAEATGVIVHNGGGEVFVISGRFDFSGNHAALLFEALPPIVHIPGATSQAGVLRWALEQFAAELQSPQPGGALMSTHLAHLMLVQALRLHLAAAGDGPQGWFRALADARVGRAVSAMHAQPARAWTLEALAAVAGMSRTVFAQRFKALVGKTAMDYLTRWRMLVAADRLRSGRDSVASVAFSLGYESESAFCAAFRRVMQCSPTQYRRQGAPAVAGIESAASA